MLLQVVPKEGQDVPPQDITCFDDPPFDDGNYLAHGVDLAISTEESAEAIVTGEVTWPNGKLEIYIQPHPIIRCTTVSETMDTVDNIRRSTTMTGEFFVEPVAYQPAAIEKMERRAFSVQAMHPIKDKARPVTCGRAVHQDGHRKVPEDRVRAAFDAATWVRERDA